MYVHSKVSDKDRLENDNYNQQYYLNKQYEHWEAWSCDEIRNEDSTPFQVAWLQNIKRLINLFHYDESSYSLIDLGCGSGISTLYFYENSNFK